RDSLPLHSSSWMDRAPTPGDSEPLGPRRLQALHSTFQSELYVCYAPQIIPRQTVRRRTLRSGALSAKCAANAGDDKLADDKTIVCNTARDLWPNRASPLFATFPFGATSAFIASWQWGLDCRRVAGPRSDQGVGGPVGTEGKRIHGFCSSSADCRGSGGDDALPPVCRNGLSDPPRNGLRCASDE